MRCFEIRRLECAKQNTERTLILLGHAFDALGCIAVEFRAHRFNAHSQRGIADWRAQLD